MRKNIIIAILAVVCAIGLTTTGAVAGIGIAKGTVGSWHIKDDTIKMKDLKPKTEQRVRKGNQAKNQINRNRSKWAKDEVGLNGAESHKPGAEVITVQSGAKGTATAHCGNGTFAMSGGYEVETAGANVSVLRNQPKGDYVDGMFTAWEVQILNNGSRAVTLAPAVVCAAK